MTPALGQYPVRIVLPVQWGEMDAFQHVNNAVYLRWCESARIAYFDRVGLATTLEDGPKLRPIMARASVDYRAPVTYPDTVTVEATVKSFGTTSFVTGYRISSAAQGRVVAEGEGVIVLLDAAGSKTPVPEALRALIHALEAETRPG